jgi:hypothetical protein
VVEKLRGIGRKTFYFNGRERGVKKSNSHRTELNIAENNVER